jgi:hypothetical protein
MVFNGKAEKQPRDKMAARKPPFSKLFEFEAYQA